MTKPATHLARFGRDLVAQARYATAHWNAGARFWLEHRAPAVGRAIAGIDGPTIWLSGVRPGRVSYLTRLCALVAEHTVVGHAGPLPPFHLGLSLPWPVGNEIPPPPLEGIPEGEGRHVPLILDAVRRPLPRVSRHFLLGEESVPLREGVISYLPAGLLFSPLPGHTWPEPVDILQRTGDMPDARPGFFEWADRRTAARREQAEEQSLAAEIGDPTERDSAGLPPPTTPELVGLRLGQLVGTDGPERVWPIYDNLVVDGFERYSDPRVYSDFWEDGTEAMLWEHRFARAVDAEILYDPVKPPFRVDSAPLAVLDLEIPYLRGAPWPVILQLREDESAALELLRRTIRRACKDINDARGTRAFDAAVRRVQEMVIDKGLQDVKRAMSGSSGRAWGRFAGYVIVGVGLQLTVFWGVPHLATIPTTAALLGRGVVDLALELRKDAEDQRRARTELPLYFVWKLGQMRATA